MLLPTSQSPAKEGVPDSFPWSHRWETLWWPGGQNGETAASSPGPFFALGPSHCPRLHIRQGVELYFVLQVNFKAQSVFRKVLQDLGDMTVLNSLWIWSLLPGVLYQMSWALCRVKFRHDLPRPAVLSTNVNDGTHCLLPNWNCSVGIYWHGIIPRRKKKKRKRKKRKGKESEKTWLHIF